MLGVLSRFQLRLLVNGPGLVVAPACGLSTKRSSRSLQSFGFRRAAPLRCDMQAQEPNVAGQKTRQSLTLKLQICQRLAILELQGLHRCPAFEKPLSPLGVGSGEERGELVDAKLDFIPNICG